MSLSLSIYIYIYVESILNGKTESLKPIVPMLNPTPHTLCPGDVPSFFAFSK